MPFGSHDSSPGQRLRFIRLARGLTIRAVDEHSRSVVLSTGNQEFLISHSTLINIEMHDQVPSIYKLHTLSVIYRVSLVELVSLYGLSLELRKETQDRIQLPKTHLVSVESYESKVPADFPAESGHGNGFRDTQVLTNQARVAPGIVGGVPRQSEQPGRLLGYIGLDDYTMFPLVRPGALVQVDTSESHVRSAAWQHELDRPIYFLELRKGYAFGWCEIFRKYLRIIPHPLSGRPIRSFPFPDEVDVLGRVCALTIFVCPREPNIAPAAPTDSQLP